MKRTISLLFAATVVICSVAISQQKQTGYFLTKLGHDTTTVEEFSMEGHELQGTSIARAPRLTVRTYQATFGDDGTLKHFHVVYYRYNGPVLSERDYQYTNDSVHVMNKQDTVTTQYSVATSEH